uniref:Uncharacterized protein n=1 Tax=Rhizophora mucronata TaxID=61149 RepID=A0A2P2N7W8_RHIMU
MESNTQTSIGSHKCWRTSKNIIFQW